MRGKEGFNLGSKLLCVDASIVPADWLLFRRNERGQPDGCGK